MTKQPTTLGAFSVSLAVKDLQASREFYEKLDFELAGGDPAQNWLILRNGTITIGLFEGMFERNVLTLTPAGIFRRSRSARSSPMFASTSAASNRRDSRSQWRPTKAALARRA
jgi:catechol 2,3-dioxygenase-like lactoylglutathione lyase family enzyme